MRSFLVAVAIVALGGVGPSYAADRLFTASESTELARDNVGKPYWALLAGCAGFFGGTSNYYSDHNQAGRAQEAAATGVQFMNEALDQLHADRGLDRTAALNALVPTVNDGRARAKQLLVSGGADELSGWNFARSTCMDIQTAYLAHR